MEPKAINEVFCAIRELCNYGQCAVNPSLSSKFRDVLAAMGIFACGGAYDQRNNMQWFYI